MFPAPPSWRSGRQRRGWLCMHPIAPRVGMGSCLLPGRNTPPCSRAPAHFPPWFCTVIKRTNIFSRNNLKKPQHFVVQSARERSRRCSQQSRVVLPSAEALQGYLQITASSALPLVFAALINISQIKGSAHFCAGFAGNTAWSTHS